jgi:GntR family transcriptional regulator/MocR family aminotransferase
LEQAALARFIESGSLLNHLKRLRNTCRVRRDALKCSIETNFGEANLRGNSGGTHMLWSLPDHCPTAAQLQQVARSVGVGIHPLHSATVLYGELLPGYERHVLLGYVHLKPAQIEEGFSVIATALAKAR